MATDMGQIVRALHVLAGELAAATDGGDSAEAAPAIAEGQMPPLAIAMLIAECRKRRAKFHPEYFFGEPCWDMLIDLFIAREQGQKLSVGHLCNRTQVPHATALRYLSRLEARGDVLRKVDQSDFRRVLVEITDAASERMVACLGDMVAHGTQA